MKITSWFNWGLFGPSKKQPDRSGTDVYVNSSPTLTDTYSLSVLTSTNVHTISNPNYTDVYGTSVPNVTNIHTTSLIVDFE